MEEKQRVKYGERAQSFYLFTLHLYLFQLTGYYLKVYIYIFCLVSVYWVEQYVHFFHALSQVQFKIFSSTDKTIALEDSTISSPIIFPYSYLNYYTT